MDDLSSNPENTVSYHVHNGVDSPLIDKKANGIGTVGGGQNVITVKDEGVSQIVNPTTLNFTGSVTVAANGDIDIPGSAISNFTDLLDVPNSYTGQSGAAVRVKSDESGLEFASSSLEFDNGNITGTATIDWANGLTQYATMTGDVTLTFTNPIAGEHYTLLLAGAFTPTFPGAVRWTAGVTPIPSVTAGKDIYVFIYSGVESLYSGLQSANYAIT